MTIDEKYMYRCLQLALNGKGFTHPNPMVGAVVVHNDKIIGEGYHRKYGYAHAEVNAINNVKDKSLLKSSTIYVSLEPCSHYGKTPPCSELIIKHQIPRVVIACLDPYPAVSGRGVKMLEDKGIVVTVGILEKEAKDLNKEFFTVQTQDRPYIYLKWAQSADGFIDKKRDDNNNYPIQISNDFTKMIVHKIRSEVSAIMVGTNTAIKDNPSLSTRLWYGNNPIRIVIDRKGKISENYNLLKNPIKTYIFTEQNYENRNNHYQEFITIDFDSQLLYNILFFLKNKKINSILVEGGSLLLQSFIDLNLWDEIDVEISDICFKNGVKAPYVTNGRVINENKYYTSKRLHLVPYYI